MLINCAILGCGNKRPPIDSKHERWLCGPHYLSAQPELRETYENALRRMFEAHAINDYSDGVSGVGSLYVKVMNAFEACVRDAARQSMTEARRR